jgi:hypothetical protein
MPVELSLGWVVAGAQGGLFSQWLARSVTHTHRVHLAFSFHPSQLPHTGNTKCDKWPRSKNGAHLIQKPLFVLLRPLATAVITEGGVGLGWVTRWCTVRHLSCLPDASSPGKNPLQTDEF